MGKQGTAKRKAIPDRTREVTPRLFSRAAFRTAAEIVAAVTILASFVPLTPVMPDLGLDPSWRFGINQAVAQGLVFGRDIVFTYGPYGSIYTKAYHPATDWMMMSGTLLLGACYAFLVVLLARRSN